jgi:cellulose 1,4-beta-cellobiosidase
MAAALATNGWPDAHFIVDQGRSGKQPTGQLQQGNWCNAIGTGFGIRPDTPTNDPNADAFVWIKRTISYPLFYITR